ncbi:MAG: hypothetical protein ACKVQJ_02505 [Pyrinomonadaceae bacterium]
MSIIPKLASSLNRRDEIPNVELAQNIAEKSSKISVSELLIYLGHPKKAIRHDAIKVIYEIGKLKPKLIADSYRLFIALLGNSDNRMQWGAMTALDHIAAEKPNEIYIFLDKLTKAAESGSVITRDRYVKILIKLLLLDKKRKKVVTLLLEQLRKCPTNQLPAYAESAMPLIDETTRDEFIEILSSRLAETETDSKRKRVEKVIKRMQ